MYYSDRDISCAGALHIADCDIVIAVYVYSLSETSKLILTLYECEGDSRIVE